MAKEQICNISFFFGICKITQLAWNVAKVGIMIITIVTKKPSHPNITFKGTVSKRKAWKRKEMERGRTRETIMVNTDR